MKKIIALLISSTFLSMTTTAQASLPDDPFLNIAWYTDLEQYAPTISPIQYETIVYVDAEEGLLPDEFYRLHSLSIVPGPDSLRCVAIFEIAVFRGDFKDFPTDYTGSKFIQLDDDLTLVSWDTFSAMMLVNIKKGICNL